MDPKRQLFVDLALSFWCLALFCSRPAQAASLRRHHHQRTPRRELLARRTVYSNPCAGPQGAAQEATAEVLTESTIVVNPLHHQLDLLSRDAASAKREVTALMQKYLTERFQHSIKHDDFTDFRLKGLPKIPKVTIQDFYEEINIQVHTSLNGTYDRLVTMDMFLHDIRLDEIQYHGDMGYNKYIELISNNHIINLLCRLRVTMLEHGVHYRDNHLHKARKHVVREVASTALRYISDYIILRELENALSYMELEFQVLRARTLEEEVSST